MAQMLGPCWRAKRCAKESGSALTMKLIPPWRYRITFLWRWRAIALKPRRSNSAPIAFGSGAAYSTNSKPSVPAGLSQSSGMAVSLARQSLDGDLAFADHFRPLHGLAAHIGVGVFGR